MDVGFVDADDDAVDVGVGKCSIWWTNLTRDPGHSLIGIARPESFEMDKAAKSYVAGAGAFKPFRLGVAHFKLSNCGAPGGAEFCR